LPCQMFKNLLSKVGWGELPGSFGFTIGEKVELPFQSVWQQHKGTKRSDGSDVSLFVCIKKDMDTVQVAAAKNAQALSKSLRHPNIINVLDSCETDAGIYVATEPVRALLSPEAGEQPDEEQPTIWGLYQALDALSFLHTSGFVHGLFGPSAIFVTTRGDYRLFGLELCKKGADAADLLAGWRRCGPKMLGWPEPPASLAEGASPTCGVDLWGAAVLSAYVFGSVRPGRGKGVDCRIDMARASQDFPAELRRVLAELQKPGPLRGRSPIAEFIALQFFQQNPGVAVMVFLSTLHIKSDQEKEAFFEALPNMLDRVPQNMQTKQVLYELLQAQKFPGQEAAQVLPAILKIAKALKDEEFKEKVAPLVMTLFASPDRSIRFRLLMSIGDMIGNLDDNMINDKIFPECVNGFTDSCAPIREATVKTLIHFVPRLRAKTVEQRITKLLIKLLQDPEQSIRTNAVICCGRIAPQLPAATAAQTLSQALAAGLKDPFGPCRNASLHTLQATCALFSVEELANRLMPQVCLRLVDPDPTVTDTAFQVLTELQKHVRVQIDERRAAQQLQAELTGDPSQAPAADTAATVAGTWGSWAMSTVGSKLSTGWGSMSSSKADNSNTPHTPGDSSGASPNTAASVLPPSTVPSGQPTAPSGGAGGSGMSLSSAPKSGGNSSVGSSLNLGGASEAVAGGWGDDDDVDWDDFDDAPVAKTAPAPAKAAPAPAAQRSRAATTPSPASAPAPVAKASVKPAAKPKPKAKVADEDDFWKEFDM